MMGKADRKATPTICKYTPSFHICESEFHEANVFGVFAIVPGRNLCMRLTQEQCNIQIIDPTTVS